MAKVLSIAGSDPSGGAGIQLDIKVFQALNAFGMAVPAALTVQNSRGVAETHPITSRIVAAQLSAIFSDIWPDAVKTGMLLTKETVMAVAQMIKNYRIRNVVIDPVVRSSSGKILLESGGLRSLKKELFPLTLIVTPNIYEAEVLSGITITNEQDMNFAAGRILDMGPAYVLIKGGHRNGPAVDTLYGGKTVLSFSSDRQKGEFHGTGCALSSALTVFIACGMPVEKAVKRAKQFVDSLLKTAKPVGKSKTKYFQF